MANTITAGNATNNGLAFSSDNSGTVSVVTGSGSGTTAVTIDGSQNVGIGGTPAVKLDVYGTIKSGGSSIGAISMEVGNSTNTGYTAFYSAANVRQGYVGYGDTTFGINLATDAGSNMPLRFVVTGTEYFRIGTSGQWGLSGTNYGTSGQVLTSAGSGAAPSWASLTSTQVGTAAAGSAVGDLGTYAWLSYGTATVTTIVAGNNSAGSGLRYWGYTGASAAAATNTASVATTAPGTWKAMGSVATTTSVLKATLYLRVA